MHQRILPFCLVIAACGEVPLLGGDSNNKNSAAGSTGGLQNLNGEQETTDDETAGDEVHTDDLESKGEPDDNPEPLQIPETTPDEMKAIGKCLAAWRKSPFQGNIKNFKRLYASVTVGGQGNAISDTERTDEPWLILIDAAVNVFGTPKYQLMNPNGWYCMKVNVNVISSLSIDLHCNARLADSRVNVNVGSNTTSSNSMVGVNVFSSVEINTESPQGDACIR